MTDCTNNRYSPYQYVIVNIAYKYGYSYCNHDVSPIHTPNTPGEGYKRYIHKLPQGNWNSGSYYLGGIYHNGTKQEGFIYTRSCHTNVVVYYWSHDEDNFCPLLIRVRKTWWSWNSDYYYEYYIRDGINKKSWTKLDKGHNVSSGLTKVIKDNGFKNVATLKLDAPTGGEYYANGDSGRALEFNTDVRIWVSEPVNEPSADYKKFTHHLKAGGSMNILCTKHQGKHKPFKDNVLSTPYNEASVYYSSKDTQHSKPLILQFGSGDNYYKLDGGKWIDAKITSGGLKDALERENGAHVIDISNTGQYSCSSPGCGTQIKVDTQDESNHNYTKRRHYIQASSTTFSASSFIGSSGKLQSGLSSPSGIAEVNVFWYPKDNIPKPLLIHYQISGGHKWFKKTGKDTWQEVPKSDLNWPMGYDDPNKDKISELLQQIDQEPKQGQEKHSEHSRGQEPGEYQEDSDEDGGESGLPSTMKNALAGTAGAIGTDWSAEQELLLVDAIAKYGLGNWTEVSEMVTMAYAGYKSEEECESHYYKIYLNSPTPPIPDLTSLVYDENGKPLIVHPSGVCPTQEKPKPAVSNKPQAKPQIIGYWPLRGDFDIEYDNDAELILADMEFRPEDTPEQIELKLNVIEIYNSKLDERIYRKKVIIERGLLDAKSLQQKERKYTSEEKELYNLLKPFLRFQTAEEHDQTVQLIVKERKLRSKLYQLMVWKTLGLKTQEDVRKYEEKVHRIEEYKDFLVKQESDPSRRHERRLRANALDLEASSGLAMNRLKITEFLDDNEIEFCESLQLPPISYFLAKRVLLQELACNTIYSVEDMCNELRIDGTKQGRIFDFLLMLSPKALRNMETEVCDLSKATLDNEGFIDHTKVVSQITLTNNNVAPVFDRFGCNKIATYMNSLDNEQEAKSVPIFGNQQKGGVSLERPIKQQKL